VRVKEKLMERRSNLIEELIKSDPTYRPPADYRPAKKHRKVRQQMQSRCNRTVDLKCLRSPNMRTLLLVD
jgi:hypothetical protein